MSKLIPPCGRAFISKEAKQTLDTVQHTPPAKLAETNIRKKRIDLAKKLLPEEKLVDDLLQEYPFDTRNLEINYNEYFITIRHGWLGNNKEISEHDFSRAVENVTDHQLKFSHSYTSGWGRNYVFYWFDKIESQLIELSLSIYDKYGVPKEDQNSTLNS